MAAAAEAFDPAQRPLRRQCRGPCTVAQWPCTGTDRATGLCCLRRPSPVWHRFRSSLGTSYCLGRTSPIRTTAITTPRKPTRTLPATFASHPQATITDKPERLPLECRESRVSAAEAGADQQVPVLIHGGSRSRIRTAANPKRKEPVTLMTNVPKGNPFAQATSPSHRPSQ